MGRRILIACENETIRKQPTDDVDLAAAGLIHSVVVIIKDNKGNASLTYVDAHTDVSFIFDEIAFMEGDYTIDIVRAEPERGELCHVVREKIVDFGLGHIPNSKGTFEPRKSKNASVLLRNGAFFIPQLIDLCEISSTRNGAPISANNLLKEDQAETGPGNFQLRIYIRHLNMYFSEQRNKKPIVIFKDNNWADQGVELDPKVKAFINSLTSLDPAYLASRCILHGKLILDYLKLALHTIPRYKQLVEHLAKQQLAANKI